MNKFSGIITQITRSDAIMLVDLEVGGHPMSALLTESPFSSSWLKVGNAVSIVFKETEVSLMKGFTGKISLRNQLPCKVISVSKGTILGCVAMLFQDYPITAAITSRSIDSLNICEGDEILALIKANEVSIMKS